MNEDILKGKWRKLKGEARKKWGKLTDDDLLIASGHKEKLVGVLQTKYGNTKEKAGQKYKSFRNRNK